MSAAELRLRVKRLPHARDLPLPVPASPGSVGVDLRAALGEPRRIAPGERALIPTGLVLEIPIGWEGQIRARSGQAWSRGLTVLNGPGTIDNDYRGEVGVLLVNLGEEPLSIERGERIAQLVLSPVAKVCWEEVAELAEVGPGRAGGFGSTGAE